MRDILFRGKRIGNGEWRYGDLINSPDGKKFIGKTLLDGYKGTTEFFEVDPETVGQYTGTNCNGKKIFEKGIIRAKHDGVVGVVRFGEYMSPSDPDPTQHIGYYVDWPGKEKDFLRADLGYWASRSDVEVIGNVHDSPELLEVEK